jgi:hypothetical protein
VFGAQLKLNVTPLLNFFYTGRGGSSTYNAGAPTAFDVLGMSLVDYRLWGKFGDNFRVDFTNDAVRGIFGDYRYDSGFDDIGRTSFVNFGIKTAARELDVLDVHQNARAVGGEAFVFAYNGLGPVNLALGGLLATQTEGVLDAAPTDWAESLANLALRVEAPKLFDILNLAAVYKFNAYDKTAGGWAKDWDDPLLLDGIPIPPEGAKKGKANGDGYSNHAFGIYANVGLLDNTLGLSLGYSGQAHAAENTVIGDTKYKAIYPYFSGLNFAVKYSGIDKLPIVLQTNFSWGSIKGDEDPLTTRYGIATLANPELGGALASNEAQSDYGWSIGANINYALQEKLTLIVELNNRLLGGSKTNAYGVKTATSTDVLSFFTGIKWAPTSAITFLTGLSIKDTIGSTKVSEVPDYKKNTFQIGVPIAFTVAF